MAVILRRLYQKVSYLNMQLIAGENGLDNLVRWIHPVESREVVPFVEEGEVVFTTGLGLTECVWQNRNQPVRKLRIQPVGKE